MPKKKGGKSKGYVSKGERANVSKKLCSQIKAARTPGDRLILKRKAVLKVPKDRRPKIADLNNWKLEPYSMSGYRGD